MEWSGYHLDCYDYKSTCGAKNAMTSARVHSLCLHEEHFRLTPVLDKEEELESSRQSAALGENKKLCHQSMNGNLPLDYIEKPNMCQIGQNQPQQILIFLLNFS